MKKIFLTFLFICIHCFPQAQNMDTIQNMQPVPGPAFMFPLGARFTIKLYAVDSASFHYVVEDYQDFQEFIDLENTEKYFTAAAKDSTIEVVFCIGTYGNTPQEREQNFRSVILLKNRTNSILTYNVEAQEREKEKYEPTPVLPLLPNKVSVETWPYPIGSIALINFRIFDLNEIVKDSICLKNPKHTIAWGDSIFASQITSLKSGFLNKKGINIEDMRTYEKKIKSREPMFFSIAYMQNDLYPNKKGYKLEIPYMFKRAECPTFSTDVLYYYTKDDKAIKAVLFEWNKFWGMNDISYDWKIMTDDKIQFKNKFNFVEKELTKLLGAPESRKVESDNPQIFKYEDLVKWSSAEGIHATLIHSGNDRERKMRLAIYRD